MSSGRREAGDGATRQGHWPPPLTCGVWQLKLLCHFAFSPRRICDVSSLFCSGCTLSSCPELVLAWVLFMCQQFRASFRILEQERVKISLTRAQLTFIKINLIKWLDRDARLSGRDIRYKDSRKNLFTNSSILLIHKLNSYDLNCCHVLRSVCAFLALPPNPAVKRDAALKRVAPYF